MNLKNKKINVAFHRGQDEIGETSPRIAGVYPSITDLKQYHSPIPCRIIFLIQINISPYS